MVSIIKNNQIASFYILSLILGTCVVYLVVQGMLPAGLIMVAATSSSLSALIITGIIEGTSGVKRLVNQLRIWKVGIQYWAFALLILPPTVIIGFYLNPYFGGETITMNMQPIAMIVPMLIMFFITAGLGEEIGWTGFLTPRLQSRYSALVSSIIRGVMWGLWHLSLFIYSGLDHPSLSDFPYAGWVAQKGFVVAMGALILINQIPWSIFYTWMYNNTKGSILFPAILHGSEVWVAYWFLSTGIDSGNFDNYWGYGLMMVLVAAILVFRYGAENLSRTNKRYTGLEP